MKKRLNFYAIALSLLLMPAFVLAQTEVIGNVTDEGTKSPLPGVTVVIKGTTTGTVTDLNGDFTLNAIPGQTLSFSYVGYTPYEMILGNQTSLNITLKESSQELDEVVVVGYGTQRKRDLTGSISKVTGDQITETPVSTFEAGLQGKAAGVQIIQSNGMAGAGSSVHIRGIGSISAGGDPLYIVDGIPINQDQDASYGTRRGANTSPMATINPNDIESIDILKDASSAAIYGSRAANGVIIITTKKGKSKKPTWDFSYRAGGKGNQPA